MAVLVTCKDEENPLKIKALEWSQHIPIISLMGFSRSSRAANSSVPGQTLHNFELIRDFMAALVTYKNKEEKIKMKELEWSHDFPNYNPMEAICWHGVLIRSGPKTEIKPILHPYNAFGES